MSRLRARRRRLLALALALALPPCVAAAPAPAAGTYDVISCADPDTHRMTGAEGYPAGWHWAEYAPGSPSWAPFGSCSRWGDGFGFQTNPIGGTVPYPHWGEVYFSPPADTSVYSAHLARALNRPSPGAFGVPMLATSPVDWCHTYWSTCSVGDYGNPSSAANVADIGESPWFELYCDGGGGCPRDGRAVWKVFGARIALADGYAPTFPAAPSGQLAGGSAILTGPVSVTVSGADRGGGLLSAEVLADGRVVAASSFDANGRCDTSFRTDLVPCPLAGTRTIAVDFAGVEDGTHAMSIRLTDVAGNRASHDLGNRTLDRGAPGAAQPAPSVVRWLDAAAANTYAEPIAMAPGAVVPSSGIAGYAVTIDGSDPGTAVNAATAADGRASYGPPSGGWPEGTVTVKARAISRAGRAGAIGQATLRFDRSAPAVRLLGAGNGRDSQPGPVTVTLAATDRLSGMGAADDGDPVERGGHIAYTLDGGALTKARGGEAQVRVAGDGTHALTFRAYDAAGNASADQTALVAVGGSSEPAFGGHPGFWDRALNPNTAFSAAASFGENCPASITLHPSHDTFVDQSRPDSAFGNAGSLTVRSGSGSNGRALLDFDLPPARGCRAAAAQLRLYTVSGAAGRTLAAYRLGSSWNDGDVTWSTRPGVTGDGAPAPSAASSQWVTFDVTAQVRALYRDGDTGLLLRDAGESDPAGVAQTFGASEGAPAQRPQLIVSFE